MLLDTKKKARFNSEVGFFVLTILGYSIAVDKMA